MKKKNRKNVQEADWDEETGDNERRNPHFGLRDSAILGCQLTKGPKSQEELLKT